MHFKTKKKFWSLKKNIAKEIIKLKASSVMFFDEARFGTHSKIGHGWFKTGDRPRVKVKLGFKNFYLYSAINHANGEISSLILPNVDTICMNMFLDNLSGEYKDKTIALIMDGAGWHKSKELEVPKNISIIYLPPYSPELNPVERLWLYIKKHVLVNKIYENLDDLQSSLCNFLKLMTPENIINVATVNYLSG